MGYKLDDKTIEWAKQRCDDLLSVEINGKNIIEKAEILIIAMREVADQVNDQPESEMMRAYANEFETTIQDIRKMHEIVKKDRMELGNAIANYADSGGETIDS